MEGLILRVGYRHSEGADTPNTGQGGDGENRNSRKLLPTCRKVGRPQPRSQGCLGEARWSYREKTAAAVDAAELGRRASSPGFSIPLASAVPWLNLSGSHTARSIKEPASLGITGERGLLAEGGRGSERKQASSQPPSFLKPFPGALSKFTWWGWGSGEGPLIFCFCYYVMG